MVIRTYEMLLGSSLEEMLRHDFAQWAFDPKYLLSEESIRFLLYHYNQAGLFNGYFVREFDFERFFEEQFQAFYDEPLLPSKRLQCLVQMGEWVDYLPNFLHYFALDIQLTRERSSVFIVDHYSPSGHTTIKEIFKKYLVDCHEIRGRKLQKDGYSCAAFALDALLELAQIEDLHMRLYCLKEIKNNIGWDDLPPTISWNAQSFGFFFQYAENVLQQGHESWLLGPGGWRQQIFVDRVSQFLKFPPHEGHKVTDTVFCTGISELKRKLAGDAVIRLDQMSLEQSDNALNTELFHIVYPDHADLIDFLQQCASYSSPHFSTHPMVSFIFNNSKTFVAYLDHPDVGERMRSSHFLQLINEQCCRAYNDTRLKRVSGEFLDFLIFGNFKCAYIAR